jgi:hypothetical protein
MARISVTAISISARKLIISMYIKNRAIKGTGVLKRGSRRALTTI